jgi:hypothetical protein
MPIFTKADKKVLFIHIPKTAGISVHHVFARAGWQIDLEGHVLDHPYYYNVQGSLNHLCYSELEEYYNLNDFDFVFCVVRNPFARAISEYHWQRRNHDFNLWFESEINQYRNYHRYMDNHFKPQSEFVGPTSKVYKLEQGFDNILADISEHVGEPLIFDMPYANESNKTISVDDIDKSLVYNAYKQDFERFGYDSAR